MTYLIVDDEPQARKLLQTYLQPIRHLQLIKLCSSALEAYEALHTSPVDVMFLDIRMPLVSGTEFLRSLKAPPLVIMTTAYPSHALEGFELDVVDYLLKPIALPRLLQAVEKAQRRLGAAEAATDQAIHYLFVKTGGKLVKVDVAEIRLVEGMQNYVKLHLPTGFLVAAYTMKEIEGLLPAAAFIRVHRSYLVAISTIKAINGNTIETAHQRVPIGIRYRDEVARMVKKSS